MNVSFCSAQLIQELQKIHDIPDELVSLLQHGSNSEYLDSLAQLALDPRCTELIYATHQAVFVEISSRWMQLPQAKRLAALSAYARILPLAPHLAGHISLVFESGSQGYLEAWVSSDPTSLTRIPSDDLETILLLIYRLLACGNERFASYINPTKLVGLSNHTSRSVIYLSARLLCLYMHASDAVLENLIKKNVGEGEVTGLWDGKVIDFRFFTLWERSRLDDLRYLALRFRQQTDINLLESPIRSPHTRILDNDDISDTTAIVGNVLIPLASSQKSLEISLVPTSTTKQNIQQIATAVVSEKPILVTGPPGSGKSRLIREIARLTHQESGLISLHLNEQTDAKILLGMYTKDRSSGSFKWHPGVITQAVTQGRWLLIEDLDRAPSELISILLPLIERMELTIPTQDTPVPCSPNFRLIATMQTSSDLQRHLRHRRSILIERQEWHRANLQAFTQEDLSQIINSLFPAVQIHVPQLLSIYAALVYQNGFANSNIKSFSPRQLLRCARRIDTVLGEARVTSDVQPVPEALQDDILLEIVDSFLGSLQQGSLKTDLMHMTAGELHIPAQRAENVLQTRRPIFEQRSSSLRIGRAKCQIAKESLGTRKKHVGMHERFARTDHALRTLESLASTVQQVEPCLLVGETGVGKTLMVQNLASMLGHKLVIANLSQQSEASDLLGGYKPINPRSLAIPMKDEFGDLLQITFPSRQNAPFLETLGKAISRERWKRVLRLWKEAIQTVESILKPTKTATGVPLSGPNSKRRKIEPRNDELRRRWIKFTDEVQAFQALLAGKSGGFAFSFVEGKIVQAARNGDWVLLDEINLASPDTLESLSDLFTDHQDGGPSLLLLEKGDVERIRPHHNFRIFASMNPATDTGKRDLPPAYVQTVAQVYLSSQKQANLRDADDVGRLYIDIKQLANDNDLVDGANQKPHFSLRTFTRALTYASDIASMFGLRRALFEGFSMCFLTALDTISASLVQPLIERRMFPVDRIRKATLHQISRAPEDGKSYVRFDHYWILQGPLRTRSQPHYILTPFIKQNLLNLVRAASTRRFPVLLQGPTSSGKTSMVDYLAKISGNQCVRINNHEHTDLQEYLGSYVSDSAGGLVYQDGALVTALKEGHWVILDELNLAPTDVLEALNRLLDDNRELLIPETQQTIRPHENFMLFATQNPPGVYGGRKVLSRAFRNRFLEIHFDDIPQEELEIILRERCQIAPSFCAQIVAIYRKLSILRQSERLFEQRHSFATLRDLFRWALRPADDREQLAINGFILLGERVRKESERMTVKETIENVLKVKLEPDRIYSPAAMHTAIGTSLKNSCGIIWTKSMRRLAILVARALDNHEPVLLVGGTGTGKTSICQVLAEMMETTLNTVNAHQNLETGDLIGAHRPPRNRELVEDELVDLLIDALESQQAFEQRYARNIESLTLAYDNLLGDPSAHISEDLKARIDDCSARAKALFEWSDGSLVAAMKDGSHFLLDEISLADDSVLERLNSLLEPSRTLYIAERGTTDANVIANDKFQFLATMNPGGDYGKRELSGALRNRFTEIWVPNLSHKEEIVEIVEAKLSSAHKYLAEPMVNFAEWYSTSYESFINMSIRDLLSWVTFINLYDRSHAAFAVFHGCCMVFLDKLGTSLTANLSEIKSGIGLQHQACVTKLQELFTIDKSLTEDSVPVLMDGANTLSIGGFEVLKLCPDVRPTPYNLEAPTTVRNAMKILRALQVNRPILLEGDPGVGKTTLVAALAQKIGVPLTRINLSDQTDLVDLFGSDIPIESGDVGSFGWRPAPFLRAMQKGEWILLDEMNLASQSVLEGLNACFDHRGEVFVPELGKTFPKHPNVVVFAAQNPYHQGSGRKGLPTSFINRFTVVYAGVFDEIDYRAICSALYPDIEPNTIKSVVRSVSNVATYLTDDNNFHPQGGPWEVNLRDALRWLDILAKRETSISPDHAFDYGDVLFSHQFRKAKDQQRIRGVIQQSLEVPTPIHNYFLGRSEHHIEAGRAVLKRDALLGSQQLKSPSFKEASLPIIESLMLCVEKHWPTLLVGPSNSNTKASVLALANLVGAEVTQICANPEMDAQDFLGTYEQADNQNKLNSFYKRLELCTSQTVLRQMASDQTIDQNLFEVRIGRRQKPMTENFQAILQALASTYPNSEFPLILNEWTDIAHWVFGHHDQPGFRWADSPFVKAVKQGHWVILDHANLCDSSVLDRLNSLLEPEGCLSIHEHRNADGSPEIVRPHTSFRMFMTMDPEHGELSRAMRNRSVELFMSANAMPESTSVDQVIEARMSRFSILHQIDWRSIDPPQLLLVISIFLDHLTHHDLMNLRYWQHQVTRGLGDLPEIPLRDFNTAVNALLRLSDCHGCVLQATQETYEAISQKGAMPLGVAGLQSIHPHNNAALLALTSRAAWHQNLKLLGEAFETMLHLSSIDCRLAVITESAGTETDCKRIMPGRPSMVSKGLKTWDNLADCTTQLLLRMTSVFKRYLNERLFGDRWKESQFLPTSTGQFEAGDVRNLLTLIANFVVYLDDVLNLIQSDLEEEDTLQAYLDIGIALAVRHHSTNRLSTLTEQLAGDTLDILKSNSSKLQRLSGLAMEPLWRAFRPRTCNDVAQYELKVQLEALADRFDEVKWSSGASVEELMSLLRSLTAICDNCYSLAASRVEFDAVCVALKTLERWSHAYSCKMEPYFSLQFDALRQYQSCYSCNDSVEQQRDVAMLCGMQSKFWLGLNTSSSAFRKLKTLNMALQGCQPDNKLACVLQVPPLSVLSRLETVFEVPISSVDLLGQELGRLGIAIAASTDTFGTNELKGVDTTFFHVREAVYDILDGEYSTDEKQRFVKSLQQLPSKLYGQETGTIKTQGQKPNVAIDVQWLQESAKYVFSVPNLSAKNRSTTSPASLLELSKDMILFFTGCLLLFVPNKPYDPYRKRVVERERYQRRVHELTNKLTALQHFEKTTSGQIESYRTLVVRDCIQALGDEPRVDPIFRPEHSDMTELQGDFDSIIRLIIRYATGLKGNGFALPGSSELILAFESERRDIEVVISRVKGKQRAYEDTTMPLAAFLEGLDNGLALALAAISQHPTASHAVERICSSTPLMGCSSIDSLNRSDFDMLNSGHISIDARIEFLETLGLRKNVEASIPQNAVVPLLQSFHTMYEHWKRGLDREQTDLAAKSSLYRHRGGEPDDELSENQIVEDLFFGHHGSINDSGTLSNRNLDPSRFSQTIARIQRSIFTPPSDAVAQVQLHMLDKSHKIAGLCNDPPAQSKVPAASLCMLPVLFLRLDEEMVKLESKAKTANSYDFYADSHIAEVRRFKLLVQKVQSRFLDLQAQWPEHATLNDVLQICRSVLELKHADPLAKLLTKAEELHGSVNEWQVVASKEYSATYQYDELTQLIISWRRLELTAWTMLLDKEDKKCQLEADSWYFIAYETIIAAPLTMVASSGSPDTYTEELLATLEKFLNTTTLGQFSKRIAMLYSFQRHVTLAAEETEPLRVTSSALYNFLGYFDRFTAKITATIASERQKLEKDLKNIVVLASWKDTNVAAIRESSKRSHHKLFKVVRKYRDLLAQPVDEILSQIFPDCLGINTRHLTRRSDSKLPSVDSRALETCRQRFEDWATTSARFTDPLGTAQNMRRISQIPPAAVRISNYLDNFCDDLAHSMVALQDATPSTLTKENSALVKNLLVQKRKLFSDTMKQIRSMGFSSNLGEETLKTQSSLAVVFSKMRSFQNLNRDELSQVEHTTQDLLKYMLEIRRPVNTRSEDITHAEFNRSRGFMESVLSTLVKQRNLIVTSGTAMQRLQGLCHLMENLWRPDTYSVHTSIGADQLQTYPKVTRWISAILETAGTVLQKYENFKGSRSVVINESLQHWALLMARSTEALESLPKLPSGLTTTQHANIEGETKARLIELRACLAECATDHPDMAFLVKHIQPWLDFTVEIQSEETNGVHTVNMLCARSNIRSVSDAILVGVQNMSAKLETQSEVGDQPKWLLRTEALLAEAIQQLQINSINERLAACLASVSCIESSSEDEFETLGAVYAVALPIVQQFCNIYQSVLDEYVSSHASLNRLAVVMARSLASICKNGFCSPVEPSTGDSAAEKIESGTGLGEGQGTEDISGDIQDDEDLSDLAQQHQEEQNGHRSEQNASAVDMNHDDLEGETDAVSDEETGSEIEDGSETDEGELDEQRGEVDELDPSAVDEKLWDGNQKQAARENSAQNAPSQSTKEEQVALDVAQQSQGTAQEDTLESESPDVEGAEDSDPVEHEEVSKMDAHTQHGEALEMPEEMDIDTLDGVDQESVTDEEDLDEMSSNSDGHLNDAQDGEMDREESDDRESDSALHEEIQKTVGDDAQPRNDMNAPSTDDTNEMADSHSKVLPASPTSGLGANADDMTSTNAYEVKRNDSVASTTQIEQQKPAAAKPEQTADTKRQSDPPGDTSEALPRSQVQQSEQSQLNEASYIDDARSDALKQLGNALEEWHRVQSRILEAPQGDEETAPANDLDIAAQELQHLPSNDAPADGQALGTASEDQVRALDEQALASEVPMENHDVLPNQAFSEDHATEGQEIDRALQDADPTNNASLNTRPAEIVSKDSRRLDTDFAASLGREDIESLDKEFSTTHIEAKDTVVEFLASARHLWTRHENETHELSFQLTEQLRVILEPTKATKMRGDFRTGKRLNMKRIIPYIASGYKRDKIWMRRSIPSKRNYQIMLAVDDSKSMGETDVIELTFQSLALVSKSLNMLEAGQVCVVRFGSDVSVIHDFDKPLTSEAGAQIFSNFSFQQTSTNVRNLISKSINIFQEARRRSFDSDPDLWQLELIVSDGLCEDHEDIRRLCREAREERIMILFVIVDALHVGKSIVEMTQALFEPDASGETHLRMKRYLDDFPFPYYLIVNNLKELPGALSQALRLWFTEVVGAT
ncbi:uncharacterized protein KY384_003090 [Bacidia gigantensis]|uniref:uncharacterized protein n=1 Tax=Bacidia gigantensis TaxID=2732470 RepID=UPI001D053AAA|nr:uncharacterized protein KY384_003090 [Bacidia gigantensis]KAG8531461.1 hypothetical protein KY384_003090 [Bacidia gigantensis]